MSRSDKCINPSIPSRCKTMDRESPARDVKMSPSTGHSRSGPPCSWWANASAAKTLAYPMNQGTPKVTKRIDPLKVTFGITHRLFNKWFPNLITPTCLANSLQSFIRTSAQTIRASLFYLVYYADISLELFSDFHICKTVHTNVVLPYSFVQHSPCGEFNESYLTSVSG